MAILIGLAILTAVVGLLSALRQWTPLNASLVVVGTAAVLGHSYWNSDIGPIPLTLDRLLLAGLGVWFLIRLVVGKEHLRALGPTDLLVGGLALLLVCETFAWDWQYKQRLPLGRLLFFNLVPMSLYGVTRHLRLDRNQLAGFITLIACLGGYLGLTGVAEQYWPALVVPAYITDPSYHEFYGRTRGPFLNPVATGIYLTLGAIAAVLLAHRGRGVVRGVWLALAMIMVAGCFLTLTRSVWLGCAVGVGGVVWWLAAPQVRGFLLIGAAVAALVIGVAFADKLNRFQRDENVTAAEMAQSASLRPMLAWVAWKMFQDRPVFGHGFGQYTAAKKPYHYSETAGMPLQRVLPYMQHNVLLSYLTESGLVGLLLLLALLTLGLRVSFRLAFSSRRAWAEQGIGLITLAFVANYGINGMFHDVSIIDGVHTLWYPLLGLAVNLNEQGGLPAEAALAEASDERTELPIRHAA